MNKLYKIFLKNTSYTFLANAISLAISAVAILIIPRAFGVEDYGFFQLYLFYSSYVGFFHFGWPDGMYLRYGGKDYQTINEGVIRTQFWYMVLFLVLCSVIVWFFLPHIVVETGKTIILNCTVLCALIIIPRSLIWLLLQALGEIVDYAKFTITEKIVYFFLIIIVISLKKFDYKVLILADLLGKGISLLYTCFKYPKIIIGKYVKPSEAIEEIKENIRVGSKLMLANIASMLIIGIVRIGIEKNWGVAVFGKVSLSISICNFLLVFINSVSLVLFPMLKRFSDSQLKAVYEGMELLVSWSLYLILAVFFPLKSLLQWWLPEYSDSLYYMLFLFPICLFESKMSLIYNTYLKTLRQEKIIMKINIYTVLLSILLTVFNVLVIENLTITVVSILVLLWYRYVISQVSVARILKISYVKTIFVDTLFVIIFVFHGYFISNSINAFFIYGLVVCAYFYYDRKKINKLINLNRNV